MGIKGVLFDLDGTIVSFSPEIAEAKLVFLKKLRQIGVHSPLLSFQRPMEVILRYLERSRGLDREYLMNMANECFLPYERRAADEAKLTPGVDFLLRKLKHLDYKLGLVSNNSRMAVDLVLRKFELYDRFDDVVTRDDVRWLKPHEEPLITAMSNLKIKPWETIYVGDSAVDVIDGKRAGTIVVSFSNDSSYIKIPARMDPDYVIGKLEDLIGIIKLIEMEDSLK